MTDRDDFVLLSENAAQASVRDELVVMNDDELDNFIIENARECSEIEVRINVKRCKLDEAISLFEYKLCLVERERKLDAEINIKFNLYKVILRVL